MSKKIAWLVVSCLMVLSLVMASCGGNTQQDVGGEQGGAVSETPKYGGTFTFIYAEPFGFDPYYNFMMECKSLFICNEELLMGDWSKGPAGTGETDWTNGCLGFTGLLTGQLAESWEITSDTTVTYHIRHGVHWWDKPPMNGRELTADDVAWGLTRLWEAGVHTVIGPPDEKLIKATATDEWTVELEFAPYALGMGGVIYSGSWAYIVPREVVEQYGDMKDWRNVNGTGAFMLTDYVPGSTMTYVRNPNYWGHDPEHPENQLPYVDICKQLIITDASTEVAALRSGKIDYSLNMAPPISLDESVQMIQQNPKLQYRTLNGVDNQLYFRVDKTDLPFKDLRVRQGLTLAINKQEIIDDYYGGHADLLGTPFPPYKAWEPFYTPLDQMPDTPQQAGSECSVRELFGYNPDKAKQLLSDAGYPNGFKCSILSDSASATDFLAIIKEYFAKVGVNLEIQQVEAGVGRSMRRDRSYDQGIYAASPTASFPYDMHNTREESFDAFSYFESDYTRQVYNEMRTYVAKDDVKYAQLLRDANPFILEECVAVWLPVPQSYRIWWPWLKNYHGEGSLGIDDQMLLANYVWIDQDLKKSMGY